MVELIQITRLNDSAIPADPIAQNDLYHSCYAANVKNGTPNKLCRNITVY